MMVGLSVRVSEEAVEVLVAAVKQEIAKYKLELENSEEMRRLVKDAKRYRHIRDNESTSFGGTDEIARKGSELESFLDARIDEYDFKINFNIMRTMV